MRENLEAVKTYVALYERHSANGRPGLKELTEPELERMHQIEDRYLVATILDLRSLALSRLLQSDQREEAQGKPRRMTMAQIEAMKSRKVRFDDLD